MTEICTKYTGVTCINGNCPVARENEYGNGYFTLDCADCPFNKQCEDCAFCKEDGSCELKEEEKANGNK